MPETTCPTDSVGIDDVAHLSDEVLPAGRVIAGRYAIENVLGRGGYAIVYRALDQHLGIFVALKILRAERASSAALNRFRREVHLPRTVNSANVVRVFDIGSDGPFSLLTMELVEGESLRDRLNRGQLDLDEVVRISRAVMEGVDALHALKIIHRDIKPENILLSEDSVKVADFGLSRYVDDETRSHATGDFVGTMRYVTPEQLKGSSVGVRGDLYTMGLVMYEMLAGRPPFEAESSVGVMLGRLQSRAPDVRRVRPDVPAWLAHVIARLLERAPELRYGSAGDVIAALDARTAPIPRSVQRRFIAAAGVAILAIALAFGAWKLMRAHAASRFSHFAVAANGGIAAMSVGGQTLWERRDVDTTAATRWVLARREPGGDREIAVILRAQDEVALERVRRLSYLDPQTGQVMRTVNLAGRALSFPRSPARFYPGQIFATDTNGDGADEIVTFFGHVPEWASFVTMYDPREDRSAVIFEGYGQHGIGGLFDLDGDGRDELILYGFNNGLGWYNAAAALRLSMTSDLGSDRSPDFAANAPAQNALLWYALLPRGYMSDGTRAVSFDARRRLFTFRYLGKKNVTLTADGFLPNVPSSLPIAARQASRFEAYTHLREARRLSHASVHDDAIREMDNSVAAALRAGEPVLVEAMRKESAQIRIAAGYLDEAEKLVDALIPTADFAAEAAYDIAKSFHLHGDLDRALRWYRRGFGLRAKAESGKSIHEFLQGIVFVHAERHAWADAEEDIARFRTTFANSPTDSNGMYREFLRWRSGQQPTLVRYELSYNATDVMRYWPLEFRYARGEDPRGILRDVEREIAAGSSETQSAMWSLRADLLMRLGRTAEARDASVHAVALLADDIGISLIARAHAEVVRERAARLSPRGA